MHKRLFALPLALVLMLTALPGPVQADELAEKGREIFKKHQRAIVTVRVVLKISFPGAQRSNENRQELTGTVVDGSASRASRPTAPGRLAQTLGRANSHTKCNTLRRAPHSAY